MSPRRSRSSRTGIDATAAAATTAAATIAALAGTIYGGHLAFETGRWRTFKAWIEGVPAVAASDLAVALFALALVIGISGARQSR